MKYLIVVAVLASSSLAAFSQTMCTVGTANGKVAKAASVRPAVSDPSILDMTFPEFQAAAAKTDIVLLPIGSIEEHGPNLPLGTDSLLAVAQLGDVQRYLEDAGIEAVVGPPLNIGITTAGAEYESPLWWREYAYAKKILAAEPSSQIDEELTV